MSLFVRLVSNHPTSAGSAGHRANGQLHLNHSMDARPTASAMVIAAAEAKLETCRIAPA